MIRSRSLVLVLAFLVVVAGLVLLAREGGLVAPPADVGPSRPHGGETAEAPDRPVPADPETGDSIPSAIHLSRGPGAVSGRVWRGDAPAVAVVEVRPVQVESALELAAAPQAALARLVTNASGVFHVSGLTDGDLVILARARDGSIGRTEIRIYRGCRVHVDVRLATAVTLRGRASYVDGRPFAGVAVLRESRAETNAEGRFRLDGLVPGSHDLRLVVPGRLRIGRRVTLPHEGEISVIVDEELRTARGRVIADEDGSPVAGAPVHASHDQYRTVTTTDAAGTFTVTLPVGGALSVTAEGFLPYRHRGWDGRSDLFMRLARGARLEGRVLTRSDGRPLAGIGIYHDPSVFFGPDRDPAVAVSDEAGRFVVENLPTGGLSIIARGQGWIDERVVAAKEFAINTLRVTTQAGKSTTTNLVVVRTGRFEGRVTDTNGEPVVRASVELRPSRGRAKKLAPTAITAEDGTFLIEDAIPDREHDLVVVSRSGVRYEHPDRVVVEPGGTAPLEIRIPLPRWIDYLVTDADSRDPVSGVGIEVLQDRVRQCHLTDRDGRARIGPLGPGSVTLRFSHERYLCPSARIRVPEDGPDAFVLRVSPGLLLGGRVEFPPNLEGIEGYAVVSGAPELDAFRTRRGSRIGPDRRFLIGPFPPGSYQVVVNVVKPRAWSSPPKTCIAGSLEHVLILPPPPLAEAPDERPVMTIRLVGPDGKPPAGGRVEVRDVISGRRIRFNGPRRDGDVYRWTVPDGVERIILAVRGATGAGGVRLANTRHGPIPAEPGEVTVRLPAAGTISGRLVDEKGKAVPGVRVHVRPVWHDGGHATWTSVTDDEGRFVLEGLGEGDHRVGVVAPRDRAGPSDRVVPAGTSDLRLVLRPAIVLKVRVTDPDGRPVLGALVVAVPSHDRKPAVAAHSDRHGLAEIPHLIPGEAYDFRVTPSFRETPKLALLRPNVVIGSAPVTVRLRPGLAIRGRVLGIERGSVRARLEGSMVSADVETDGSFELLGLTAETWTLTVHAFGLKGPTPTREVRPGEIVEIDLREE